MSLYAHILGSSFERLAPLLKRIHDGRARKRYVGRCSVRRGDGWVARAIAFAARLPRAHDDVPVSVDIESSHSGETWLRRFGEHEMRSTMRARERTLEERLGLVALTFELSAETDRIVWLLNRARLIFLPLPTAWFSACTATESIVNERYCFDVRAEIIGVGLIVHYKGWLVEHERDQCLIPAPDVAERFLD